MSVEVKGLGAFDAAVKSWFAAVEEAVAEASVGLAHEAFEQILETGPQFSGDFVANSRVSIGSPDTTFEEGLGGGTVADPFKMGDPDAQDAARSRATWETPELGQSVFISSTAKHDEFYLHKVENGEIALRDVNRGADHIYHRARDHVAHRYTNVGKVQLDALRKNRS